MRKAPKKATKHTWQEATLVFNQLAKCFAPIGPLSRSFQRTSEDSHEFVRIYRAFCWFVCAFANCGNRLLASSCLSVLLYIPMEQLGSQRTDLHEIWYEFFFWNSVEINQVSLKYEENNLNFTWRPTHIFDHILFNSSRNEKCFRQKSYRKSKQTFYVKCLLFRKFCRLWDNVEKYYRAGRVTDDNIEHALCTLDT